MEGGVGEVGGDGAGFAFGVVEDHSGGGDASPEGVEAAAAEFFAGVGGVFLFPSAKSDLGPKSFGLPGLDGIARRWLGTSIAAERRGPGRESSRREDGSRGPRARRRLCGIAFRVEASEILEDCCDRRRTGDDGFERDF